MNNFTLNEKNNITNSLKNSAIQGIGIVNYYHNATSNFEGGVCKKYVDKRNGKNGRITNQIIGSEDIKLNETINFIFDNISRLGYNDKNEYWRYFIKTMFLVRDHKDGNGVRLYFYKTFLRLYEELPNIAIELLPLLTGAYDSIGVMDNDKPFGGFLDLNNLYGLCDNQYNELKRAIEILYIKCLIIDKHKIHPSLAVKWVPRENKKNCELAKQIALNMFGGDEPLYKKMEKYRKFIGEITKKTTIVETLMTEGRWDEIDPENIPSRALRKYLYALKNEIKKTGELRDPYNEKKMICREKMLVALNKSSDKSNLKVSGLYPHEIIKRVLYEEHMTEEEINDIISVWNKYEFEWHKSLENENIDETDMDLVIMSDISSSMLGPPMEACIALSLLFTNRLKKPWKNKVLTFDSTPIWHNIPEGLNIYEKIKFLHKAPWGGSTNIGLALDMILSMAIKNNLSQTDMPSKMLILSDMQFDQACRPGDSFLTGFEYLEGTYKKYGYKMPALIFWNLRGNTNGYVNKTDQRGTTMLSGFNPILFKNFMSGNFNIENTPWDTLKDLISSDRLKKLDKILNLYLSCK